MDDTDDVMSSRVVLKDKEVENDDLEKERCSKPRHRIQSQSL